MACVFISYRRRDNPYVAGILRDALQERFGIDEVFFDLDNIPFGVDFRQHIANAVGSCGVLLVVIGDKWLHLTDEQGGRRIEDPSDFVRIEIEAALKRDIPVVPVLIEAAQMPPASQLPESIRGIAFRNAAEIRAGRDQKHQVNRLVSGLAESLKARISRPAAEDSAPSEEAAPVAPKAREEITHQAKAKAAPAKPSVKPVTVAEAHLAPSVLQGRAAFTEKARNAFEGVTNSGLYFADAIPLEKATAATTAYAPQVPLQDIMLLYDSSVFGSAKCGVLLTTDAIYWHNLWGAQGNCPYADMRVAVINANNNLLIDGEKEIVVVTEIVRGLMKLLVELLPDLQLRGTPAEESVEPISASISPEEAAFLEQVRRAFQGISDRVWIKGEIPPDKARAAGKEYAPNVPLEAIMLLYDDTCFQGAKDGMLLTLDSIYWHNQGDNAEHCRYSDIKDLRVEKTGFATTSILINGKAINVIMGDRKKIPQAIVDLLGRLKA